MNSAGNSWKRFGLLTANRVSNLTLACHQCNQKKGNKTALEFGFPKIQEKAKQPLKDAAAVNATRWEVYRRLQATGLPVEVGTGGRTKFNRSKQELPKTHWLDAACVGEPTPAGLQFEGVRPLMITATGHGNRQMCGTDKYGFPIRHRQRQNRFFGFQTGDIVQAVVPKGKKAGMYVRRVLVRATGNFDIQTQSGRVQGIHQKYCLLIHATDGYNYQRGAAIPLHE